MDLKNNFDDYSFCPEVYNQIQIDMQGDLRICCLSSDTGLTKDENGNVMNVQTHSILEAMNSKEHRQHRLELSNNMRPSRCSNCYNWEVHGQSRRKKFINFSKNGILPDYTKAEEAFEMTSDDGSIDTTKTKLVNLDIRFGNLCNLKCVMCDPGNSSLWYDDWETLANAFDDRESTGRSLKFRQGGIDPKTKKVQYWKADDKIYLFEKNKHGKLQLQDEQQWWETESWKMQFKQIAPQLRYIYFTGGEPLLVPAMKEHLEYLIEAGFSKDIRLAYDTNLTAVNDNIISKWKHFKKVELRVSVDETGDRYNIVRNPGNFNKLKDNILLVKNSGIPVQNISMVCSLANIYGSIRVSQFAKEIDVPLSFRFVHRPGWLNVHNLPQSARSEIVDNLRSFLDSEEAKTVKGYEDIIQANIKQLSENLHRIGNIGMIEAFVKAMNTLDTPRKTNWKCVLTDVVDLIQRHCPSINLDL